MEIKFLLFFLTFLIFLIDPSFSIKLNSSIKETLNTNQIKFFDFSLQQKGIFIIRINQQDTSFRYSFPIVYLSFTNKFPSNKNNSDLSSIKYEENILIIDISLSTNLYMGIKCISTCDYSLITEYKSQDSFQTININEKIKIASVSQENNALFQLIPYTNEDFEFIDIYATSQIDKSFKLIASKSFATNSKVVTLYNEESYKSKTFSYSSEYIRIHKDELICMNCFIYIFILGLEDDITIDLNIKLNTSLMEIDNDQINKTLYLIEDKGITSCLKVDRKLLKNKKIELILKKGYSNSNSNWTTFSFILNTNNNLNTKYIENQMVVYDKLGLLYEYISYIIDNKIKDENLFNISINDILKYQTNRIENNINYKNSNENIIIDSFDLEDDKKTVFFNKKNLSLLFNQFIYTCIVGDTSFDFSYKIIDNENIIVNNKDYIDYIKVDINNKNISLPEINQNSIKAYSLISQYSIYKYSINYNNTNIEIYSSTCNSSKCSQSSLNQNSLSIINKDQIYKNECFLQKVLNLYDNCSILLYVKCILNDKPCQNISFSINSNSNSDSLITIGNNQTYLLNLPIYSDFYIKISDSEYRELEKNSFLLYLLKIYSIKGEMTYSLINKNKNNQSDIVLHNESINGEVNVFNLDEKEKIIKITTYSYCIIKFFCLVDKYEQYHVSNITIKDIESLTTHYIEYNNNDRIAIYSIDNIDFLKKSNRKIRICLFYGDIYIYDNLNFSSFNNLYENSVISSINSNILILDMLNYNSSSLYIVIKDKFQVTDKLVITYENDEFPISINKVYKFKFEMNEKNQAIEINPLYKEIKDENISYLCLIKEISGSFKINEIEIKNKNQLKINLNKGNSLRVSQLNVDNKNANIISFSIEIYYISNDDSILSNEILLKESHFYNYNPSLVSNKNTFKFVIENFAKVNIINLIMKENIQVSIQVIVECDFFKFANKEEIVDITLSSSGTINLLKYFYSNKIQESIDKKKFLQSSKCNGYLYINYNNHFTELSIVYYSTIMNLPINKPMSFHIKQNLIHYFFIDIPDNVQSFSVDFDSTFLNNNQNFELKMNKLQYDANTDNYNTLLRYNTLFDFSSSDFFSNNSIKEIINVKNNPNGLYLIGIFCPDYYTDYTITINAYSINIDLINENKSSICQTDNINKSCYFLYKDLKNKENFDQLKNLIVYSEYKIGSGKLFGKYIPYERYINLEYSLPLENEYDCSSEDSILKIDRQKIIKKNYSYTYIKLNQIKKGYFLILIKNPEISSFVKIQVSEERNIISFQKVFDLIINTSSLILYESEKIEMSNKTKSASFNINLIDNIESSESFFIYIKLIKGGELVFKDNNKEYNIKSYGIIDISSKNFDLIFMNINPKVIFSIKPYLKENSISLYTNEISQNIIFNSKNQYKGYFKYDNFTDIVNFNLYHKDNGSKLKIYFKVEIFHENEVKELNNNNYLIENYFPSLNNYDYYISSSNFSKKSPSFKLPDFSNSNSNLYSYVFFLINKDFLNSIQSENDIQVKFTFTNFNKVNKIILNQSIMSIYSEKNAIYMLKRGKDDNLLFFQLSTCFNQPISFKLYTNSDSIFSDTFTGNYIKKINIPIEDSENISNSYIYLEISSLLEYSILYNTSLITVFDDNPSTSNKNKPEEITIIENKSDNSKLINLSITFPIVIEDAKYTGIILNDDENNEFTINSICYITKLLSDKKNILFEITENNIKQNKDIFNENIIINNQKYMRINVLLSDFSNIEKFNFNIIAVNQLLYKYYLYQPTKYEIKSNAFFNLRNIIVLCLILLFFFGALYGIYKFYISNKKINDVVSNDEINKSKKSVKVNKSDIKIVHNNEEIKHIRQVSSSNDHDVNYNSTILLQTNCKLKRNEEKNITLEMSKIN